MFDTSEENVSSTASEGETPENTFSGHAASETLNTVVPAKKGERKQKNASKDGKASRESKEVAFIGNSRKRTEIALKRGRSLHKSVTEYKIQTGAEVSMKIRYVSEKGRVHQWSTGEQQQHEQQAGPSLASTVKAAVKESMDAYVEVLGQSAPTPSSPGQGTSSVFSPVRRPEPFTRRSTKKSAKNMCAICMQEEVLHGGRLYHSEWVNCSHGNDDDACLAWVHADCLGFPGITLQQVEALPDYYCRLHNK